MKGMVIMKKLITKTFFAVIVFLALSLFCTIPADAAEIADIGLPVATSNSVQNLLLGNPATFGGEEVDGDDENEDYVFTGLSWLKNFNLTQNWWNRIKIVSLIQEDTDKVPLYNQLDFPNTPYGRYGSVASHGCGITSLAMVASYLQDVEYSPADLAKQFGNYNTEKGSYWILFEDSAKVLGLDLQERTYDTKVVMEALRNGQVVIALQGKGLFTDGGHFIVLTGLTEEGKILVNDPNGANYYKNSTLIKGFAQGFTPKQVFADGGPYWIYAKKAPADNVRYISQIDLSMQ